VLPVGVVCDVLFDVVSALDVSKGRRLKRSSVCDSDASLGSVDGVIELSSDIARHELFAVELHKRVQVVY